MDDLDLCKELELAMQRLGFKESSIQSFKLSENYIKALGQTPPFQRTYLILYFYDLLMYKGAIPTNIRVAIGSATESSDWLREAITILLPFAKVNEDTFFPA